MSTTQRINVISHFSSSNKPEGDKLNILGISTGAKESILYSLRYSYGVCYTKLQCRVNRIRHSLCAFDMNSLNAEKSRFLTHWPVMTFRHPAKPAGFLSRHQTALSHQGSQQYSGAFTNDCVPDHPESLSLQGPGDFQRVSYW